MAIDRIQPPTGVSPSWQPDERRPAEVKEASKTHAAGQAAAPVNNVRPEPAASPAVRPEETAAAKKEPKKMPDPSVPNPIEFMAEKLKALQAQSQTDRKITSLDQELYVTRQELRQAAHQQLIAEAGTHPAGVESSYWSGLDVVEKARTINQLKDRLQQLELERSALVKQAAQQLRDGTYSVTGAEILAGMLEEFV